MKKNSIKLNYFFNLLYQLLSIIIPVITTPYLSRVLSPKGIGEYNYSFSITTLFMILSVLGSHGYAQREIAFNQNNKEKISKLFFEILIIRLIACLITTPIFFYVAITQQKYSNLLLSQYIMILSTIFDISWFFQGLEEFKKLAIRNISLKIITTIAIFIFVNKDSDLIIYSLLMSISLLMSSLTMWPYCRDYIEIISLKKINIRQHFRPILMFFIPVSAVYIYTSVDKILLGVLANDIEVGYYSQADRIVRLLLTVITSLGTVLLPRIANLLSNKDTLKVKSEIKKSILFVSFIGFPMCGGLIAISPIMIPWFLGKDFQASVLLVQFLSSLTLILGFSSVTGQAVLIPLKKQNFYTVTVILGAIINIVGNFILVPHFLSLGSVISTLISEVLVCALQTVVVFKILNLNYREIFIESKDYIIGSIIMTITLSLLVLKLEVSTFDLLITVLTGFIIYFSYLLITKNILVINLIKNIRTKKFKSN
ncbi:flippase [Streptococcus iniae]|uniref:Capsular biosynthesis protein CpsM n=3 Tax=Streptococcus iniae TaxID=1346 RepID=A0A1J0MYT8_STRIN|nr:flippase [Streptococcus iniae]AGM98624.1 CpsM [Streptococcus iniae SF1]AHY15651.1 capsular biosynthesis protein CpsM [Streptococcus iniae]AHY17519.1 capsular biosynthesis protein CpsM [Streptococcus iniae]AJG25821.1 capsular biosynthesis protein CpsM [Streptococcus iniae]APD31693.1 capsular biosynthesis protein CpsM [Streptococcus iniae]